MKKIIRLTESDLHRIIKHSVNKILSESKRTLRESTWRGVPGTKFIWHGEWSDPEIEYKGELINSNDAEEGLWYAYKDECEEMGQPATDRGFDEWVDQQDPEYLASMLDDYVYNQQDMRERG